MFNNRRRIVQEKRNRRRAAARTKKALLSAPAARTTKAAARKKAARSKKAPAVTSIVGQVQVDRREQPIYSSDGKRFYLRGKIPVFEDTRHHLFLDPSGSSLPETTSAIAADAARRQITQQRGNDPVVGLVRVPHGAPVSRRVYQSQGARHSALALRYFYSDSGTKVFANHIGAFVDHAGVQYAMSLGDQASEAAASSAAAAAAAAAPPRQARVNYSLVAKALMTSVHCLRERVPPMNDQTYPKELNVMAEEIVRHEEQAQARAREQEQRMGALPCSIAC